MADTIPFQLFDSSGQPLATATPVFQVYADRSGFPRSPPTINNLGNGLYNFTPTDDDEKTGTVAFIDCGNNVTPRRLTISIFLPDNSNQFWTWHLQDNTGALWAGAAPTFQKYVDPANNALTPPPITAIASSYLFIATPTINDVNASVSGVITSPIGALPASFTVDVSPIVFPLVPQVNASDYTNSRPLVGAPWPENAITTARSQYEPLITADQLKSRHLFGIPLISANRGPNGAQLAMTDDILADYIDGAVAQAELELKIDIFPVKRREKHPFDLNHFQSFGYFQLKHRPCTSIDKLSVTPSNMQDVYVVPNDWVEGAYLHKGQVNIVPLTVAFVQGTYIPQQSSGGAAYLQILGNKAWIPAWWQIEYTSGFPDGLLPRALNEYIGTVAAIEVLSQLAATYARVSSHSLGIDGLSQSVSTPGPQLFKVRVEELEAKKLALTKKIKAIFGFKVYSGTI